MGTALGVGLWVRLDLSFIMKLLRFHKFTR